jgi:ribosome biogenesis protein UTP30
MAAFPGFREEQVGKAVNSLLKFVGQQAAASTELLADEGDELVYLQLSLKKAPAPAKAAHKPIAIKLPHPLYTPEGASICLFVKDGKGGEGHAAAKKRLASMPANAGITKVVGLSKLRTKFESHEAKRALCAAHDLFLADDRVLPSLPKLIGKAFFKKRKQPIPVDLRTKDWPGQVAKACGCTYMLPPAGTCVSVRVGRSSQTAAQIGANVAAALKGVVGHVPKGWANVQGVFLKAAESVALPVYQALPNPPSKIVV